ACVISLTQAGAEALGKYNITVNSFSPGFVKTPLWDGLDKDLISAGYRDEPNAVDHLAKTKAIPGHVSTPDDLVGATTFLDSSRSDYITGQNLRVDGGVRLIETGVLNERRANGCSADRRDPGRTGAGDDPADRRVRRQSAAGAARLPIDHCPDRGGRPLSH